MEIRDPEEALTLTLFYVFWISLVIVVSIFICASCLSPRKARIWMLKSFKILFKAFCFRLKCNKVTTDMEDIIDRFSAYIPGTKRFFKTLEEEYHFRRVLDILNASISEFQFSIMPAGSLREGFGKIQPSTSALASDYDMMLIPEDCFAQFSQGLKLIPRDNTSDTDTIFEAIRPSGTEEAFCWLKLKDDLSPRHEHWKRFTVYKKVDGEDVLVLSNDKVRFKLKEQLISAKQDLGYMDALAEELSTGEHRENKYIPNIEVNGPAVTIKITKVEEPRWKNCPTKCFSAIHMCTYLCNCCCCCGCFFPLRKTGEGRELYSFYSDFTLSIPCKEWPVDAAEWFTRERNWPTDDIVDKIKTSVTHLVPKPSTSLSPITFIESQDVIQEEPDNTQIYGNLPPTGLAQADKSVKKSGVEFRISFSQPEAILASHAPVKTKETYLAFKSTIKRLQEQLNIPGRYKIETFALKSIFYRTLEKLPLMYSFDNKGARKELLKMLFENLYALLSEKFCPHYWISTMNLFKKYRPSADDLPETVQYKATVVSILLSELENLNRDMTPYVLDDWVEHNRCLMDHCCFYNNSGVAHRCLPVCEVPYTYSGTSGFCCGPPPDKEENEIFAVY